MTKLVWWGQAALFYLFTWCAALLPAAWSDYLGRGFGLLMRRLLPSRRKIAVENIRLALPYMTASPLWAHHTADPEDIVRQVFINIGRSLMETCRLYHGRADALIDSIEIRGMEHYQDALSRGKGVVFLTGHCGNWELVALAFSRRFRAPMSVVARRQNNPYLNAMVEKMRLQYDNLVIYKDNAMRSMMAVIRKNGAIGLLVDQAVFAGEGARIPFLGRMALASKGPVILARKTGAAILPSFIHREGKRHVLTFHPVCDFDGDSSEAGMAGNVKQYSEYIEQYIVAHPTDWYWIHRRWKRAGEPAP